jgi:hypothetical protein
MNEHIHGLSHLNIRIIDAAYGGKKILMEPDSNLQVAAPEDDVFHYTLLG